MSKPIYVDAPVLSKHDEHADAARARLNLHNTQCRVAYRWTDLERMPLFGTAGEIPETDDEPKGMKASRSPGIPVPEEDYAEVIAATGVTPPAGWKLYVYVPIV